MLGSDQGPPDLPGNFAFTHDGGVQPGAHGEQVLGHLGSGAGAEGTRYQGFSQAAGLADPGHEGRAGSLYVGNVGGFAVDFEAVAGGQDHRACDGGGFDEGGCGNTRRTVAQLSNGFKIDVGVCSHQ